MKWGYEDDMFDFEIVHKTKEEKERHENEKRPDGRPGLKCGCCYFCNQTLR